MPEFEENLDGNRKAIENSVKRNMDFTISLEEHNGTTLRNLVNLIYSRGALISKATGGHFRADEKLVKALRDDTCTYSRANFLRMLADFESRNGKSLYGVEIDNEKIRFTGFGEIADIAHMEAYTHLAVLMNGQALRQKRVQAKNVDDTNEKYAMRIWLRRIGMGGPEFKKDRAILMEKLGGQIAIQETETPTARKADAQNMQDFQQNTTTVILQSEPCAALTYPQPDAVSGPALSHETFRQTNGKPEKLKVAAYIRVSTDMTDQENSYEAQERYFNQLLIRNEKWISAGIYSDYGITGTSGQKRTGFKRILRHCQEGRIDRIVTKSISRFARNTVDFMTALNTLHEAGVTILFEKEGLDTADSTSSFILTTLAAIAQEESRSISANLIWGNRKRFPRGDVRNQDIYGYRFTEEHITTESGYRYKDVTIVEEEAEVVRWIFQSYVEGRAFKDMARELNRRCIPYKVSHYAKKRMKNAVKGQLNADIDEGWTSEQINSILKNERYTGNVLVQKTYTEDYLTHKIKVNKGEAVQYWVKDHHPTIISQELFRQAREMREVAFAMRSHYGRRAPYAFSGRLICGSCGRFYNIRNVNKYPIWFCPSTTRNNGKNICHNEKIYEEQIVRMFRKAISERFQLIVPPVPFSGNSAGFVRQMLTRLENIQRMDFMERDRAFIKRQIAAASMSAERARRRVRFLQTRKEALENGRLILTENSVADVHIADAENELRTEVEKQAAAEAEEKNLTEQLEYMENYWEELEADHECREKAIEWMRDLPEGEEGLIRFLNDMTDTYVKAFALSITIHDPLHYTVHWFDDTSTDVEMYTNIKDHRCAAAYFDGHIMREKEHERRA